MDNKWRFNRASGREILDKLAELLILAAVFLIPLWLAYFFPTYNIFELNKAALFRSLVWFLLAVTVARQVFYPSWSYLKIKDQFRKYWLWPTLFIVVSGLLTGLAVSPVLSFYGTLERQQGLVSYLAYFVWFILVTVNFMSDISGRKIRRTITAAALSASLVSVYGILQVLNIDFLDWPYQPHITLRTFSTLGQPNFLASWLLLAAPLSIYLYSQSRKVLVRFGWLLAFILQTICFFLTGSRGGFLGLLLLGLAGLVFWMTRANWSRVKKVIIASAFIVAVITSLVVLDLLSDGRVREMKNISYGSLGARVTIYGAALDAWLEKPVFGYGLENGEEVFIKYYTPEWGIYGKVGQTADRAHNLFLDALLSGGLVGLVIQLILIWYFFNLFYKNWRQKENRQLSLALAAGGAGYLLSLLVSFTIVTGEVYFWFFLGLLVVLNESSEKTIVKETEPTPTLFIKAVKVLLVSGVVIVAGLAIVREARMIIADHYFQAIYATLATEDYFTSLVLDGYLNEQRVNPVNQEAYDIFWAGALSEFYPKIKELAPRYVVRQKLERIDVDLPLRGHKHFLAKARVNRLLENYDIAETYLQRVLDISPLWPTTYYEQGNLRRSQGDLTGAALSYATVLASLPPADDWRLNEEHKRDVLYHRYLALSRLGDIHFEQQNYAAAASDFSEAFSSNPDDYSLLKRIGDSYYLQGDLETAITYNERGLSRNPDDYAWHLALAVLHHERGDNLRALEYIESARKLAPDNEQLKALEAEYKSQ